MSSEEKSEAPAQPKKSGIPDWERRIAVYVIAVTLVLASLTSLFGYSISRPGYQFVGQAYNIDDFCVYLSWTRQAADGHFFGANLFTTDPQRNLEFNALFLVLGQVVRFTHLPIGVVFLLTRIIAGGILLTLIYRFYLYCAAPSPTACLTALALACLGAGFGWLFWPAWADKNAGSLPTDVWQPEAFTFLSLYVAVLFTVSTVFIVGAMYSLLLGERTGQARYAVYAGLCGLVLGNVHSYDVLHIAAAWGLFLIVKTIVTKRFDASSWGRALIAGAITLPTSVYQYYVFLVDKPFHERALVHTLSPPFSNYTLGYGLILILAVVGILLLLANRKSHILDQFSEWNSAAFIASWAVAGFGIIYLPHISFQRKMLMGEDLPLCLLAGSAAAYLVRRFKPPVRAATLAALVIISFPTNALFLYRDYTHILANRSETSLSPFLLGSDIDALSWIRENTRETDAVLGFPELMVFVPGYCDRPVYLGHWGETPQFQGKMQAFGAFAQETTPDDERIAFLRTTRCAYFVYPNDTAALNDGGAFQFADFAGHPPSYLVPVHRNKDYTIFSIRVP
jgi:hypothetical protein